MQTSAPYLVLAEQEGEQHQHASIVHNPPHINVSFGEALAIGRVGGDVFRDKQSQVSGGGFPNQLCSERVRGGGSSSVQNVVSMR